MNRASRAGGAAPGWDAPSEERRIGAETFILGVGAQKCGTTWLHDYLAAHPQAQMPVLKELHYFDLVLRPDIFRIDIAAKMREDIDRAHAADPAGLARARREAEARKAMTDDPESYVGFFRDLRLDTRLTGDITPSYSGLSAENFRQVRTLLRDAGVEVRVVFLMRDPVARAISQARMVMGLKHGDIPPWAIKRRMLRRVMAPGNLARARYDLTVRNLQAAFAPEELHLEFFERFFNEDSLRRLCAFLGLDYVAADFRKPENKVSAPLIFTDEDRAQLYRSLRPVYDGCREIFGNRIPESWESG